MTRRREFLMGAAGALVGSTAAGLLPRMASAASAAAAAAADAAGPAGLPSGARSAAVLEALPGKLPLIKRTFRPPNYETPLQYLGELYTPNEAFFVRYHLAGIPEVDAASWRLKVGGEAAARPVEFSLNELRRKFPAVEIAAVNQCSGNRRGLVEPHVPGIEWGYGAMGNARWKGVRLKDVLDRAGLRPDTVEIVLAGADQAVLPATPKFVKSLPVEKARDPNVLIAYEMNGAPLPHWNGFPARLVVPGWTATYWMKHLTSLEAVSKPFDGFWMKTAYRIPNGAFPASDPFASQATEANTPITSILVNSLVTNVVPGQQFAPGQPVELRGVAWDGGTGIRTVEISADQGRSWAPAELLTDAGPFSFRPWRYRFRPPAPGNHLLQVRATSRGGATQPVALVPNPAGYHHNVIQALDLVVG